LAEVSKCLQLGGGDLVGGSGDLVVEEAVERKVSAVGFELKNTRTCDASRGRER
jgi:hypothetical protein